MVCKFQYPHVVYRDGERKLWNPVSRKTFVNRPEERVRLRLVDYLIHQAGWSKNRISFELPVRLNRKNSTLRADLVCYTKEIQPMLLVECKAEQVPLNESVATQIAEYAQHVKTPWWLVTNGRRDIWFDLDSSGKPQQQNSPPGAFKQVNPVSNRPFEYWQKRAFLGDESNKELDQWLEKATNYFFNAGDLQNVTYLSFSSSPLGFDISHYYQLKNVDETDLKMAWSFLRTPRGTTQLMAIFNKNGENRGLIVADIDLMYAKQSPNTKVYTKQDLHQIALEKHLKIHFDSGKDSQQFSTLTNGIAEIFNQYQ